MHVDACCDALEQRVAQAEQAYMPQKQNTVSASCSPPSGSEAAGARRRRQQQQQSAAAAGGGEVSMEPIDVVSAEDFFYLHLQSQPPVGAAPAAAVHQPAAATELRSRVPYNRSLLVKHLHAYSS